MGNSFLEGGEQNSATSGIGPLKRGLEEAGLLRPAVAPQSQRSLDSALGQAHTLLQATRNQHRLPGQPEAPWPSAASLIPLKEKIREGSSSSSRTQLSTLPAPAQERPGGRGHKTSQSSLQSLDLLIVSIWRANGPSPLALLPLACSPLWYVHPSLRWQAALIFLPSGNFGVKARTQVTSFLFVTLS